MEKQDHGSGARLSRDLLRLWIKGNRYEKVFHPRQVELVQIDADNNACSCNAREGSCDFA